jgi:hypothetical protein
MSKFTVEITDKQMPNSIQTKERSLILWQQQTIPRMRHNSKIRSALNVRYNKMLMKTMLVTSIATITLTHATQARDWAWFQGDIGIASPFVLSSSPTKNVTIPVVTKRKAVAKRSVTGRKSDSTRHRVTAR